MIHFFQPLDPIVNGSVNQFFKKKFVKRYGDQVKKLI